jgi:hypothetical protein
MAFVATLLVPTFVVQGKSEAAKPHAIALAEKVGQAMFLHDKAAWQATDALMEARGADPAIRGWISLDIPGGWLVRFIRVDDSAPCAAYE